MKTTEMLELLRDFHRDKFVMRQRHASTARFIGDYDFNNTYQYVIAREDNHLRWLTDAIADLGGEPDEAMPPDPQPPGKGRDVQQQLMAGDREDVQRFMDKWRPRVDALPNARHRAMLNVILGETLEQKRFLDLALAGRRDLLGRRADGAGTPGRVLEERWVGDLTK